jgi:4-hydroxybenzoate polyprenyltransferase
LPSQRDQIPDALEGNWVDRYLPELLRPFARLARWDRPIGWWLLLLPCWWSSALAADSIDKSLPSVAALILFLVGAITMRGAGCTYNDIVDRDLDVAVARTRARPIPSGQVTVANAALFLIAQLVVGLVVLLQFNTFTIWFGLGSLFLVALYPFLKRITNWPQIGLGLAFSWGALLGWAAEIGSLAAAPLFLYAGGILWTIGYDSIYAIQDIEDDGLIGVRSTALLFGPRVGIAVAIFYAGAVILFATALALAGAEWAAFAGLAVGLVQLAWQASRTSRADSDRALALFRSNRTFGLILFVGIVADSLITA